MPKIVTLILSLALTVLAPASTAMADDASDIQALITADMTARDFQQPGVFYEFDVITSVPFAYVQTLLGTSGYAAMTYALSKSSGLWKILGSGGGHMVPSILVDYGMPIPTAEALQGFACRAHPNVSPLKTRRPRVTIFNTSVTLKRLVAKHGPSVLPRRKVLTHYYGRVVVVTIIEPLQGRVCLVEPI